MDDLKKKQLSEDLLKVYQVLEQASHGGRVWLTVEHGRTKTLGERHQIQSPLLSAYSKAKEKEIQDMQTHIDRLKAENDSLKAEKNSQSVDDMQTHIDGLKAENDSLKAELEELKAANKELSFYLDIWKKRTEESREEADAYLTLAAELETEKEKKRQSLVCNGKALELPPRVIKEVIRQWCLGCSIKQIQADTGASRGQIERIVKGNLKHKESRKKVLKCINHLLKVNQNVVFIDKLKTLKDLYSK